MKNNKEISVSVIIPTWNREKTLIRAVNSVLCQTLSPLEVLVCDDGSTDNSFKIVESLKNYKVKWIAGEHSGLPAVPRNRGIKTAKGEWLAFLDSDDEWLPLKLEKQLRKAREVKSLAICTNAFRVTDDGRKKNIYLDYSRNTISMENLLKDNSVISSSVLIHKSLISKCVGFPKSPKLKAVEDYAFWLRISSQTKFIYWNEPLVNYFDDPESSIRKSHINIHLRKMYILQDFLQWGLRNTINKKFMFEALQYYLKSVLYLLKTR